ncbi:MAG: hypothetical protein K1X75_12310 [Leptospirales bacterium]|nr:hypothetical protein [Leptospirales bacterium]
MKLRSTTPLRLVSLAAIALIGSLASPALALGSYAEGWVEITIKKFESSGVLFNSFEGTGEIVSYDKDESCNDEDHQCYTPTRETMSFSVRPETRDAVNALRSAVDKTVLIRYRIHRVEAAALGSSNEVLEVVFADARPADLPERMVVRQTGGRRNFSVQGRILSFRSEGTAVKTYEGLYLDSHTNKVHPFSVTDENMAAHIERVIQTSGLYYLGVSEAYVSGLRHSNFDIFEINFNESAGAPEE